MAVSTRALAAIAVVLAMTSPAASARDDRAAPDRTDPPAQIAHGVYPGGPSGNEDDLVLADLLSYEAAAGKEAAWVYFSDNWFHNHRFPLRTARWIREQDAVPFIRLMLRSDTETNHAEPKYTLPRIINGRFDRPLRRWFLAARRFGTPLMVDFGVEVNGDWFPWNGAWNGAGRKDGFGSPTEYDGPERFRAAYRHVVSLARELGADNIDWVFHVNDRDSPATKWNRMENYYPGRTWVDAVAVSVYGAQTPMQRDISDFRSAMDGVYPRLVKIARRKPFYLAEFGAAQNPRVDQAEWTRAALSDIAARRWPLLAGISWWNERWQNDDSPAHDTTMRLQDNPLLAQTFQEIVGADPVFSDRLR